MLRKVTRIMFFLPDFALIYGSVTPVKSLRKTRPLLTARALVILQCLSVLSAKSAWRGIVGSSRKTSGHQSPRSQSPGLPCLGRCLRRCTGNDATSSPAQTSWRRLSWLLGKWYRWAPSGRVATYGSRDSAPWSRQTAAPSVTFLEKRLAKKCVFTCHGSRVCSFENKQSNVLKLTHFTADRVRNTHAKTQVCILHTNCKIFHWSWERFLGATRYII